MRTRKEILKDLEKDISIAKAHFIMLELLLDIRDISLNKEEQKKKNISKKVMDYLYAMKESC